MLFPTIILSCRIPLSEHQAIHFVGHLLRKKKSFNSSYKMALKVHSLSLVVGTPLHSG